MRRSASHPAGKLSAVDEALHIREFWFGPRLLTPPEWGTSGPSGSRDAERYLLELDRRMQFWFDGGEGAEERANTDATIAARFSELLERACRSELAGWADSPRRRLSLIILLDQFPRHIFRGHARAFACDGQALGLTLSGMQSAADGALELIERLFFYMPLLHAEDPEVQEESVVACRRLLSEAPAELRPTFQKTLGFAEAHRAIVRRFGRFPARNRALGRITTPEEQTYLETGGETFGQ